MSVCESVCVCVCAEVVNDVMKSCRKRSVPSDVDRKKRKDAQETFALSHIWIVAGLERL